MNIEKITTYGKRESEALREMKIVSPMRLGKDRVLYTDRFSAIIIKSTDEAEKVAQNPEVSGESFYASIMSDFVKKDSDVSSFLTTVGDLVAWLRKDTDPCPFCGGTGPCPSVELDDADEKSPELDDANSLHYGWLGVAPIRRSRLDELLSYIEASDDTKITVKAVMNERPASYDVDKVSPFFGAVWVEGEDFEVFLAGLAEKTEAAPKFHLEGKFTTPELTKAGKSKVNRKSPTEVFGKKAKAPAKKAAPKAPVAKPAAPASAPKKAPAKKPVTKTKVVTKGPPPKSTGNSLLDRARAKKAAGRKGK